MMGRWKAGIAALGRSLFGLTEAERRLLGLILTLALLGLGIKWWTRSTPDAAAGNGTPSHSGQRAARN